MEDPRIVLSLTFDVRWGRDGLSLKVTIALLYLTLKHRVPLS